MSSRKSGSLKSPSPDALSLADISSSESPLLKEKSLIHEVGFETNDGSVTPDCEDEDFEGDGRRQMTMSEYNQYCAAVRSSGGFDVSHFPGIHPRCGMITPIHNLEDYGLDILERLCIAAVNDFNNRKHKMYDFLRVLQSNIQADVGFRYYITFEAYDPENSTNQILQAEVLEGIPEQKGDDLPVTVSYCELKAEGNFTETDDMILIY